MKTFALELPAKVYWSRVTAEAEPKNPVCLITGLLSAAPNDVLYDPVPIWVTGFWILVPNKSVYFETISLVEVLIAVPLPTENKFCLES